MIAKREDEVVEMYRRCVISDEVPCHECPYRDENYCFKAMEMDVYTILKEHCSKKDGIYQMPLPGLEQ